MKKGALKVRVEVSGNRLDAIFKYAKEKNICLYDVKYLENKSVIVVVDYNDLRKFFAICKNMCYNTKVKGYGGAFSFVAYLLKYSAAIFGFAVFLLITTLLDNVIFKIECVGTGSAVSAEIISTVNECGIAEGGLFSNVDYDSLENKILTKNANLTFVSCYKSGNRLIVDSVIGYDDIDITSPFVSDLISEKNGIIESINVLRGTAAVDCGDKVVEGQPLVYAYYVDGETNYETNIIATVSIVCEEEYFFKTEIFSDIIMRASITKAEFLTEGESVSVTAVKKNDGYLVKLYARYVYYGG